MIKLLAMAVVRLDKESNDLQAQDSFILFLTKDPQALLPQLLEQAKQWHLAKQDPQKATTMPPLRLALMRHVAQALQERVLKIHQADAQDPLKQTAIKQGILLPDGQWPYLRWCHQKQGLKTADTTPISATKMEQLCADLIETLRSDQTVIKFHSLQNPNTKSTVVPWRLQINVRHNDAYDHLRLLAGNGVWQILGVSLKCHAQRQSKLGLQIQKIIQPSKGKGKGKQKTSPWWPSSEQHRAFNCSQWRGKKEFTWQMKCNAPTSLKVFVHWFFNTQRTHPLPANAACRSWSKRGAKLMAWSLPWMQRSQWFALALTELVILTKVLCANISILCFSQMVARSPFSPDQA